MSITDTGTDVGATAPEVEIPEGDTSATTEPVEGAVTDQPTAEQLDFEQYGNHVVKVKVGDEESHVPLSELRDGYQRQSDYTKKTQELAEARKRLSQAEAFATAFDRDPQGTLRALNSAFGYNETDGPDWDSMDPQEQRMATIEAELEAQRAHAAQQQIEREFTALRDEFGDIDTDAIANYAYKNNLSVTDAHKLMTYDDLRSKQKRAADEERITQQKRQAQVVQGGGGTQRGAVAPATNKKMSIRESYMAALKQVQGK